MNKHFEIPRKIPDIPEKVAGIFFRQLARLEQSPCAPKRLLFFVFPVYI
jgi:hypothetical protein